MASNTDVWAVLVDDEDAQQTLMAARQNGGNLSRAEAATLSCEVSAFSTLEEMGLTAPMRNDASLTLNRQGTRIAEELAKELENGQLRQEVLERSLLRVARVVDESIGASEVLMRLEPAKFGRPWEEGEVVAAIVGLGEDGSVHALRTGGGAFLGGITRQGRTRLSPTGGRADARTRIVNDHRITISGDNVGNAATGGHATQTSTLTVGMAPSALDFLLEHVDDLPEQARETIGKDIEAAKATLAPSQPDAHAAASFLQRARNGLGQVAASPKTANFIAVVAIIEAFLLAT